MEKRMKQPMTVRGYAKINLHLDITGRLEDGYHRVATVMQTVSLYDEIRITLQDSPIWALECSRSDLSTGDDNLVIRAARIFAEATGEAFGARIALEKNIPVAAGLAGGSTDAAATLRGLNRLFDNRFSAEELCAMGTRLGADVPFCLVGGTCYADGKGDCLRSLAALPPCFLVLACGGEGVSTVWAYGELDRLYGNFEPSGGFVPKSTQALLRALENGYLNDVAAELYNIFESPVCRERPMVDALRQALRQNGASGVRMSGSGPSVFGLFENESDAERAAAHVRSMGAFATVCRPIGSLL